MLAPPSEAAALARSEPTLAPEHFHADETLQPGMQVGEYQILGKIGEGGMGTVYSGVHPLIGKRVAIKVLNLDLARNTSMAQRFVQEARAVNQIGHHNIVDIFAFGQLPDGRQYFVMEFLPGRSLKERVAQWPPPSYEESFSVLLQVCDALAAAHEAGIVHRDLKPDNIFLMDSKSKRAVKLLDFGVAKLLHNIDVDKTGAGVSVGTPRYMSPEQCLGKPIDARTDIYALGVVMFSLFTGRMPFAGESYVDIVHAHISSKPAEPSSFVEIPADLERLILDCLAKNPEKRPQSIRDLRRQLFAIAQSLGANSDQLTSGLYLSISANTPSLQSGDPAKAGSISRARVTSRATLRRRRFAMGLGLVVMVGGALLAIAIVNRPTAKTTAQAPAMAMLQVVSDPTGARVTLDGTPQALVTPSVYHVERGKPIALHLDLDGFESTEKIITIEPGTSEKAIKLALRAVAQPMGKIEIQTGIRSTRFFLDGKLVGGPQDQLKLDQVPPGSHHLRAEAHGFEPREEWIEIRTGIRSVHSWQLKPTSPIRSNGPSRGSKSSSGTAKRGHSNDVDDISGFPPR